MKLVTLAFAIREAKKITRCVHTIYNDYARGRKFQKENEFQNAPNEKICANENSNRF